MKMQMSGQLRLEQRMKLAPKMIQSMEILQLPLIALEEKIEAELNSNPVLELAEQEPASDNQPEEADISEKEMVVGPENDQKDDFERLASTNTGSDFDDYMAHPSPARRRTSSEKDYKQDALNNTAAPQQSLYDYLTTQWRLVDADEKVKLAGQSIIDFIDNRGYLTVQIEQLHSKDNDYDFEDLKASLKLVQTLDPPGVGARDIKESFLIQLSQWPEDVEFEERMIHDYMKLLLDNRLPEIAKKMDCSTERINQAISKISRLDTSPGLQIGVHENPIINVDVIVIADEDGQYIVTLKDDRIPTLKINSMYFSMAKAKTADSGTKDFLQKNIRSAQWLMEAIEQRRNTLLNVTRSIVKYQKEFLDKGKLHLKPLPMSKVADDVGIHIATVSRAVSGKYMQCPQGIVSLRSVFSGGVDSNDGQSHSYNAIKAKLQELVDNEDKSKPYNDDQLKDKLEHVGLGKIARRTVAKYRSQLNIPSVRFRKKF